MKLARELHRATRGLSGPRIPFDARYCKGSLVYYRYGVFRRPARGTPGFIQAKGGRRYRDKRAPGRAVPSWLEDPFRKSPARNSKKHGLLLRDLLVFKAKAQRGKGGVYGASRIAVDRFLLNQASKAG